MTFSARLLPRICLSRSSASITPFSSCGLVPNYRSVSTSHVFRSEEESKDDAAEGEHEQDHELGSRGGKFKKYIIHPVETSLRYMKSNAYKRAYGDEPVWVPYRRNFKGEMPPATRKKCVRKGHIQTGNPCPVCRDEYLVVHYKNTALLDQFMSSTTGKLLPSKKTGVCQEVHFNIKLEIMKAYDFGTMQYEVPFRHYDYNEFYPDLQEPVKQAAKDDALV